MAAGSNKRVTIWTYAAACRTLPYVRLVLRDLREGFVAIWHLYKAAGGDVQHPDFRQRIRRLGDEARLIFRELDRLGVIPYQSPSRGIALFPFLVHKGKGSSREAYYVYKDSRDEIGTYIFADDLCERNDLYADERPVPENWKNPGAIPGLEREEQP
jgi:hypothetical protein